MTLYDLLVHLNAMLLQIMFFISKRTCMAFGRPVITGSMFFTLLFFLWVTLRVNMIPISLFARTPSFLFMLMIVFFSVALMISWITLQQNFTLTSQGSVGAYLGIDIKRTPESYLELSQPGVIQKIIMACGVQDQSCEHITPSTMILTADATGPPREHNWNFRFIIGMLNCLASSTQPDIAFAVQQCVRFSTAPCRVHKFAIRRIARCLKGASTKGYILCSSSDHTLNWYVDADFAGTWSSTTTEDPNALKSRTGYVITFASCPVFWCSKLQTEIALSTTEAEYIALSQSAWDLIPMHNLLHELSNATKLIVGSTIAHSTVFEDNKGCVELASAPCMHPRTRHIALKYHHFCSHVMLRMGIY
jgi:hypothetical protein